MMNEAEVRQHLQIVQGLLADVSAALRVLHDQIETLQHQHARLTGAEQCLKTVLENSPLSD